MCCIRRSALLAEGKANFEACAAFLESAAGHRRRVSRWAATVVELLGISNSTVRSKSLSGRATEMTKYLESIQELLSAAPALGQTCRQSLAKVWLNLRRCGPVPRLVAHGGVVPGLRKALQGVFDIAQQDEGSTHPLPLALRLVSHEACDLDSRLIRAGGAAGQQHHAQPQRRRAANPAGHGPIVGSTTTSFEAWPNGGQVACMDTEHPIPPQLHQR